MHWLFLAVLAIAGRATFSLGTKVLSRDVQASTGTQNVLLTGASTLIGLALTPLLGGISFEGISQHWVALTITIVCASLGGLAFFMGQRHLDAGTTQITFASILPWGVVFSVVFLGSHFSAVQAAGIALLFVSIILAQYRKGKRRLDAGVLWIITAAALLAAFQVASAQLSKHITPATYLLLAYGGPTIIVALLYAKSLIRDLPQIVARPARSGKAVVFAASTSMAYYLFSYLAYNAAPDAGVVVVLLTSQVVISVLLGIIFLKERDNMPQKLGAGALAFAAGVLIKIG